MNSSKTPRFTASELESLRLWSMPDVSGADSRESETVELEEELTPILTVDEIEAMQKQAYDEAFAQGKMHGFQQGFDEGSKKATRRICTCCKARRQPWSVFWNL